MDYSQQGYVTLLKYLGSFSAIIIDILIELKEIENKGQSVSKKLLTG